MCFNWEIIFSTLFTCCPCRDNKHNYEVITANYNCFIIATFTRIRGTANLFYHWPGSFACYSLRPSFYKSVRLCAACIKLLESSALY